MNEFLNSVIKFLLDFRAAAGDFIGPRLYIFQLLALLVSGLLVWLIIYCISRSGWLIKRSEEWMDRLGVGDVGRTRQLRAWNQIVRKMKTKNVSNWKQSILEASRLLDEVLKSSGYRADTAEERFKQIQPEELSNLTQLQEANRLRNRVAQEPDFVISYDDALAVLKVYKKSFQEFGLLD